MTPRHERPFPVRLARVPLAVLALSACAGLGALLTEPRPAHGHAATAQPGTYRVQWGDTLAGIAARFGTTVRAIMDANGLTSTAIIAGRVLQIPGATTGGPAGPSIAASASDLEVLARVIHGEARGEPYAGKVAVGAVVLNRVRAPHYPGTIRGVVFQRAQFSAVWDGQYRLNPSPSAYQAARDALAGDDPGLGALHYYNPYLVSPSWARGLRVTARIGRHVFLR
ncbi:MAG: cell wall hydrolase [Planctomycetes bacterium]|nr:cell wall hydrolase [Planctomycetota bacterium]